MATCPYCKKEYDTVHSFENCAGYKKFKKKYPNVAYKFFTASLKETPYSCPECGRKLQELAPDELFHCEECDLQWDREELKIKPKQ